jgi:aryl-alcohol dehydrogenase-like predicted oxidoreductase
MNRRNWLVTTAGVGATLGLTPRLLEALRQGQLLRRAIPSTGEMLPAVGLGSSATFSQVARSEDLSALRAVFEAMVQGGGSVFDTAPGYGASEQAAAGIVNDLGLTSKLFWATKVNVAGRGGGKADPAGARAQIEQSLARYNQPKIDLIQVHNLGDVPTQLPIVREFKAAGRVRYVGVTTTFEPQYAELEAIMRNEPLDFIGIDYAADNRGVEEKLLPLAQERKVAVLAYAPFGRTSLFRKVAGKEVPDWAREFDATTWAQVFLKFVLGHPAITCVTPATSQAKNMSDNIAGGVGRLPDEKTRDRISALVG